MDPTHEEPPPEQNDPYRAVWQMNQVGDARATGRRKSNLHWTSGIIAGLVTFVPFGLMASAFWGWWQNEMNWGSGGWATVLIGLAAGFSVGGFVASES